LVHQKVIDEKYIYSIKNTGEIEEAFGTNNCSELEVLKLYNISFNYDILKNHILHSFQIGKKYEVLKYNFKDSIAYIKVYYHGNRIVEEQYRIAHMRCLHDTLPVGYKEYEE
jgi:hypothetical protein